MALVLLALVLASSSPLRSAHAATEALGPAGTWVDVAPQRIPRSDSASVPLADGRVLVVGGMQSGPDSNPLVDVAEVYDPVTDTWTETGPDRFSYVNAYEPPTLTLLADGRVLAANKSVQDPFTGMSVSDSALYDPLTNTWSPTAPMAVSQRSSSMIRLLDGRVLAVGGDEGSYRFTRNVQAFDPVTATWSRRSPMLSTRWHPALALLPTGEVLAVDSETTVLHPVTAEIYNPFLDVWRPAPAPRCAFDALSSLPDGRVLGGSGTCWTGSGSSMVRRSEIFDPVRQVWRPGGTPTRPRLSAGVVSLADRRVMLVGGADNSYQGEPASRTAEVYDTDTDLWRPAGALRNTRTNVPSPVLLKDGRVLVTGALYPRATGAEVFVPNSLSPQQPAVLGSIPTALTLAAGYQPVRPGHATDLSARLSAADAAGVDGQPVQLYRRAISGGDWTLVGSATTADGGKVSFSDSPREPSTYTVRYRGGPLLSQSASDDVQVAVGPGPYRGRGPGEIRAVAADSSVQINWTTPTDDGGAPIDRYRVIAQADGYDRATVLVDAATRTATVPGLQNGKRYTAVVCSENAQGLGCAYGPEFVPLPATTTSPATSGTNPTPSATPTRSATPTPTPSTSPKPGPTPTPTTTPTTTPTPIPVTVAGTATRATTYGATVVLSGKAAPGSSVGVWFRQSSTSTFVQRRTVKASPTGAWSTSYLANDDYRVYAAVASQRSAEVLIQVAPTISGAATRVVRKGSTYTIGGTGIPGATVTLHLHKAGTPTNDYSILRTTTVRSNGAWSWAYVASVDYRFYATLPNGRSSATVLAQAR